MKWKWLGLKFVLGSLTLKKEEEREKIMMDETEIETRKIKENEKKRETEKIRKFQGEKTRLFPHYVTKGVVAEREREREREREMERVKCRSGKRTRLRMGAYTSEGFLLLLY